MINKANFTLLLFIIIPLLLKAQFEYSLTTNSCFSDQLHKTMLNENPYYNSKHQIIENQLHKSNKQKSFSSRMMTAQTIPVVVHIVHLHGAENISDGQVKDAIQHLNEAFENIGFYDPNTGVNTEIDFCLTIQDPQNNATTGINRIVSSLTNLTLETQDLDLKGLTQWNPLDYMNIWVVNEITSASQGPGVAGYAYLPAAHGLPEDGIVTEARYFGSSIDNSKILVHEVGHYLGLYHTFEGGCANNDCLLDGDRVCDTPPDKSTAPVDCGETINTCYTDEDDTSLNNPFRTIALGGLGDQNDMFSNYMDYGHLPCYSEFTEGQKVRMKNVLSTTRQSLLSSISCQAPCPFLNYEASFTLNPTSPVLAGEVISFTNSSDAAQLYEWSIGDQVFSNEFNSTYTFDEEGIFKVSLLIRDTINHCESTDEQIIEVVCEGFASFITESTETIAGETIMAFKNTSTSHHASYEWYLDGNLYSTEHDISITFTNPGLYSLYLVGATSKCLNYSTTISINVDACTEGNEREMHWHFGEHAALDFNYGDPISVSGSKINSFEGTSCMSDKSGDLLFYTNGIKIWDATNTVMPNGNGLMGGSTTSARNQALVIPRPNKPNQYYVFTVDEHENWHENGVRYSIVDMTLNGGLGDVTNVKNVFLCATDSEELSAAYHNDGERAWLVIRTEFYEMSTFLISSTGIELATTFSDENNETAWSHGDFFNSGKRMILSWYKNYSSGFVILDFDNINGVFSNPLWLPKFQQASGKSLALSPDDSKLYVVMGFDPINYGLFQFDLSLTTGQQIFNSMTKIKQMASNRKLLLGPNGKIYHTNYDKQTLGVINRPNQSASNCGHVSNFVDISPGTNMLSLPKFIKGRQVSIGVNEPIIELGPDRRICKGHTTVLNPVFNDNYHYEWQDGSTNPSFTAWLPGTYWVTVSNECGSATDFIEVDIYEPDLVDLGDDIVSTSTSVTLDAGAEGDYYLWKDGSTNSSLTVTQPGEYWVTVTTKEGCYQSDTISVSMTRPVNFFPSSLKIYPNPSTGIFFLEEENIDTRNDVELVIFDALGRKFYERTVFLEGRLEIDMTQYPAGVYVLHWSTYDDKGMYKLISTP